MAHEHNQFIIIRWDLGAMTHLGGDMQKFTCPVHALIMMRLCTFLVRNARRTIILKFAFNVD